MFQYALVANNGEVHHVVSSGSDSDYTEGETYHGLLAVQVAYDIDAQNLIETKYYASGEWFIREARQNPWQDWVGNAWLFNAVRFASHVRSDRNNKISVTDWTQSEDSPLTTEKKAEWATYRQALRDIPATYSDADSLDAIIWPIQPEV